MERTSRSGNWYHRMYIVVIRWLKNIDIPIIQSWPHIAWNLTCMVAITNLRVRWNISSSVQVGCFSWIRLATTLCHLKKSIPNASRAGFWLLLGSPTTVDANEIIKLLFWTWFGIIADNHVDVPNQNNVKFVVIYSSPYVSVLTGDGHHNHQSNIDQESITCYIRAMI